MDVSHLAEDYYYYSDPIGYGSFSIIYKGFKVATHNEPKKTIAIKQITKIIDNKYFNNEISLMKKLKHPNILQLIDVVRTKGIVYIILEYCNGGDLSKYISSDNINQDYRYFSQILSGLEYLHKNNILHRDIKPQNILIHNNNIKISDFGFAKAFEKNELITTFCGSPLYMAPEIIIDKEYNAQSDIWSLGVIIYELFTKSHPYYTSSKKELWDNIKSGIKIDFNKIDNNSIRYFLEPLLISNPYNRCDWDNLFYRFNDIKHNIVYDSDLDIESSDIIKTDDNITYDRQISNSVLIPGKRRQSNVYHSINSIDGSITDYDDYKIISKSAPNNLGESYMEHYIKHKTKTEKDCNMQILGTSPQNNSTVLNSYLNKSYNAFKNMFGYN
tara:strand:- start:59 stop:1216 length:1158 start_codon:yes stop_codon:yes gene_type:complete